MFQYDEKQQRIPAAVEDQRVENYTAQTGMSTPEHPLDRKPDGNP